MARATVMLYAFIHHDGTFAKSVQCSIRPLIIRTILVSCAAKVPSKFNPSSQSCPAKNDFLLLGAQQKLSAQRTYISTLMVASKSAQLM